MLRPQTIWPWLVVLAVMSAAPLLLLRFRKRRMTYTNQTIKQLLAASDTITRASNLRVLRGLAAQGALTSELATAAGIKQKLPRRQLLQLRYPRPRLPVITRPALSIPAVRWPRRLRLAQWWHIRRSNVLLAGAVRAVLRKGRRHARQSLVTERAEIGCVDGADASDAWTAAERAQAAVAVIVQIWRDLRLRSIVTAVDTARTPGSGTVMICIDLHPDDDGRLDDLPARIKEERPTWRAAWRHNLLSVVVHTAGTLAPVGGALLLPVLNHGRGGRLTRFLPLASCRHLGLYGTDALRTVHAMLGELLFAQPPADLALMLIDQGELTPLYRDVAHLVPALPDGEAALARLADLLRPHSPHVDALTQARPLVLVVVEPDPDRLQVLATIIARLRTAPEAPLHVLLVQERRRDAGRELYARLPALVTGTGLGRAALLPGGIGWPKQSAARLAWQTMRLEGHPLSLDDSALAAMVAQLSGTRTGLRPTVWDYHAAREPAAMLPALHAREAIEHPSQKEQPPLHAVDTFALSDTPMTELADGEEDQSSTRLHRGVEQSHTIPPVPLATDVELERTEPLSRPAVLLRAANAAGRAAAPPLQTDQGAPCVNAQALLLTERAVLGAAQLPTLVHPIAEPDNGFPVGPAPLGRAAMAELLARIVSAPAITVGQANEVGVTKNRLVDLLKGTQKAQARELAEWLLAWFDLAGLLAEPEKPGRLRHPRALTTTNLVEIAALLNATACPDKSTVQLLWERSNAGQD